MTGYFLQELSTWWQVLAFHKQTKQRYWGGQIEETESEEKNMRSITIKTGFGTTALLCCFQRIQTMPVFLLRILTLGGPISIRIHETVNFHPEYLPLSTIIMMTKSRGVLLAVGTGEISITSASGCLLAYSVSLQHITPCWYRLHAAGV